MHEMRACDVVNSFEYLLYVNAFARAWTQLGVFIDFHIGK